MRERLSLSHPTFPFVYAPTDSIHPYSLIPFSTLIDTSKKDGIIYPDAERPGIVKTQAVAWLPRLPPIQQVRKMEFATTPRVSERHCRSDSKGNHPDIPCRNINSDNSNCIGTSIGLMVNRGGHPVARAWHGTHVLESWRLSAAMVRGVTSMVPDCVA
jgi:hypothetical protein